MVGFHLEHRETTDLDLFTSSAEAFERARIVLPDVVSAMGGALLVRQDSPGFRRVVLTTLVSRQEIRDLVDVLELERRGLRVEGALAEANAKDGGCTPATLAFLLSEWHIPDNVKLPPGYSAAELRAFKDSLAERLIRVGRWAAT